MFTMKQIEGGRVEASVVLSTGEIAGTGYGADQDTACYFAAKDAMSSPESRHQTAGRGHLRLCKAA